MTHVSLPRGKRHLTLNPAVPDQLPTHRVCSTQRSQHREPQVPRTLLPRGPTWGLHRADPSFLQMGHVEREKAPWPRELRPLGG